MVWVACGEVRCGYSEIRVSYWQGEVMPCMGNVSLRVVPLWYGAAKFSKVS